MRNDLEEAEKDFEEALAEQREYYARLRQKTASDGDMEKSALMPEAIAAGVLGLGGLSAIAHYAALSRLRAKDKHRQRIKALKEFEELENARELGDIETRVTETA